MDIHSQPISISTALEITRVVDDRCNSLENPGKATHPNLVVFGRGPTNAKMFFLDDGVLQETTEITSGGAWLIRLAAETGSHCFSVCTSSGAVSPSWDITVVASTPKYYGIMWDRV
ncbi:hypothetical protein [Pseudomonas sp. ICMP 561]|uniref:hypothetical protein n=1 Tax=Pseudomonas sp. ICMP 561 TaxID=1718918 RepID=UPI000C08B817|nr:hypothetical protein [Pseudomonas sp. ICMP 561]PHN31623.1 hypothetical protein AO242_15230 [Pseudomonas sp. ICMP 561]